MSVATYAEARPEAAAANAMSEATAVACSYAYDTAGILLAGRPGDPETPRYSWKDPRTGTAYELSRNSKTNGVHQGYVSMRIAESGQPPKIFVVSPFNCYPETTPPIDPDTKKYVNHGAYAGGLARAIQLGDAMRGHLAEMIVGMQDPVLRRYKGLLWVINTDRHKGDKTST
jgi:hypothetical protein